MTLYHDTCHSSHNVWHAPLLRSLSSPGDAILATQLRYERLSWVHTETSVGWAEFDYFINRVVGHRIWLTEASSIVCYNNSAHPTHLETNWVNRWSLAYDDDQWRKLDRMFANSSMARTKYYFSMLYLFWEMVAKPFFSWFSAMIMVVFRDWS